MQLVNASDCGSEDRGFDSHYPPQIRKGIGLTCAFFVNIQYNDGVSPSGKAQDSDSCTAGSSPATPVKGV